jgi:hypothetical protein
MANNLSWCASGELLQTQIYKSTSDKAKILAIAMINVNQQLQRDDLLLCSSKN